MAKRSEKVTSLAFVLVPAASRLPSIATVDPGHAQQFLDRAITDGHEGVITDELLRWQTERFLALEIGRGTGCEGHVVHVRPEQVVEIAVDGVQASTRYPGGVALRFARVRQYRHDKPAAQADTIEQVQALLG